MTKHSLGHITELIDYLQAKIDSKAATAEYVADIQRRLNSLSPDESEDNLHYYQYALELQALIYYAQDMSDDVVKCLEAAVEQAGAAKGLYSRILKKYVHEHLATAADSGSPSRASGLSLLTVPEQNFMRSQGLEGVQEIEFLVRRPWQLALLFIVSGGFYGYYWFYKNWQAIRDAGERSVSPFWRSVFGIFYLWQLFTVMGLFAKTRGFRERLTGGALAVVYVAVSFANVYMNLYMTSQLLLAVTDILVLCVYAWCVVSAQRAAMLALSKRQRPINYVELLFTITGALLFFGSFLTLI